MSILLREGFGNLPDGTQEGGVDRDILGDQWTEFLGTFALEDRGDGRKWVKTPSTSATLPRIKSQGFSASSTFALGFRVIRAASGQSTAFRFTESGDYVLTIGVNSDGYVLLVTDPNSRFDNERARSSAAIPAATETYVEVRVEGVAYTETSTVKIYLNGVLDSTHTNVRTAYFSGQTTVDQVLLFMGNTASGYGLQPDWKWGDIIVHTDASPLGDVGIHYKAVAGDIGTPDFTPSAGSDNYAMLDEIGPDEDTTYNESDGTAGHRDQFSAPGLSGMAILEVCDLVRARKTEPGTVTLLLGMEENLTEDQSAAKALSEDYLTLLEGWATNPDTSAAWTTQEATDSYISYEVGA